MSNNQKRNQHQGGGKRDAGKLDGVSKPSGEDREPKTQGVILLRPCKCRAPGTLGRSRS